MSRNTPVSTAALQPQQGKRLLDPRTLDETTAKALADLLREGMPAATVRAYEHGLRYWRAWYSLRYGKPLPLPDEPVQPVAVMQFIADHVPRTVDGQELAIEMPGWLDTELVRARLKARRGVLSHNTIRQRLAILSALHKSLMLPSPMLDGRVAKLLQAANVAAQNQGRGAKPAPPLPAEGLDAMLTTCEATPAGDRDRALLSLMYHSGGRRRSEIRWVELADCERHPAGYVVTLRRVKARARDEPLRVPLRGNAAAALDRWIERLRELGVDSGPVFVSIRGTAKPRLGDKGLSGHAVAAIIKRRLRMAGLDERYTAHSLRSGYVTDRLGRGESYPAVMAMTGHTDSRTIAKHYHRPQDVLNNTAAMSGDEIDARNDGRE